MPFDEKAKAAWPLRDATLKRQEVIRRHSSNAVSSMLVWNQLYWIWKTNQINFRQNTIIWMQPLRTPSLKTSIRPVKFCTINPLMNITCQQSVCTRKAWHTEHLHGSDTQFCYTRFCFFLKFILIFNNINGFSQPLTKLYPCWATLLWDFVPTLCFRRSCSRSLCTWSRIRWSNI